MTASAVALRRRLSASRRTGKIVLYVVLVILALVIVLPLVWMLLTSFKHRSTTLMYCSLSLQRSLHRSRTTLLSSSRHSTSSRSQRRASQATTKPSVR